MSTPMPSDPVSAVIAAMERPDYRVINRSGWTARLVEIRRDEYVLRVFDNGRIADYGCDDMIEVPCTAGGLPGSTPHRARGIVTDWAGNLERTENEREAARRFIAESYPLPPETLGPDWQQIAMALKEEVGVLTRQLARAKEELEGALDDYIAADNERLQYQREIADWRDRMAAAIRSLNTQVERAEGDAKFWRTAYDRDWDWADEESAALQARIRNFRLTYGRMPRNEEELES